jgi:hypothetical protein
MRPNPWVKWTSFVALGSAADLKTLDNIYALL